MKKVFHKKYFGKLFYNFKNTITCITAQSYFVLGNFNYFFLFNVFLKFKRSHLAIMNKNIIIRAEFIDI